MEKKITALIDDVIDSLCDIDCEEAKKESLRDAAKNLARRLADHEKERYDALGSQLKHFIRGKYLDFVQSLISEIRIFSGVSSALFALILALLFARWREPKAVLVPAALLLIASALLIWLLLKRHRANAYRRQALAQLSQLTANYSEHQNTQRLLADTNALLKSVALVSFPRRAVAASNGEQWLALLNNTMGPQERFPETLVSGAYQRTSPAVDVQQLQRAAATWIKQHEVAR